jgi:Tfp pilus assembly protein PilF
MPAPVPSSAPLPPPASSTESFKRPLPQESGIREQSLEPQSLPPALSLPSVPPVGGEYGRSESPLNKVPESAMSPAAPLPDDSSLLAKITPGVTPQRAASLRLTDEASKLLESGETAKAIHRLERTITIDSTNPYGYFYLAKAQHRLGRYRESLNFLDVAEPRLSGEAFWLAEVHALRGENFRALGQLQRAEESYAEALRLNSGNRTAADALSRLRVETPSASR